MAHHKLRALGVSLLHTNRLIANDPNDLYRSPIVTNKKRPMTAVFHAQYSFIYVTALDVAVYAAAPAGCALKEQSVYLLARNVPRMEAGHEILRKYLKVDESGKAFSESFDQWSIRVIETGRTILNASGFGMPEI